MNRTQFTPQKVLEQPPLSMSTRPAYTGSTSQPQSEVTAHTDVRRHYPPRFTAAASATTVWLLCEAGVSLGCAAKQAQPAAPAHVPSRVQVLVQAGPALNLGADSQPWPTAWTLYQLRGDPEGTDREPLDIAALLADPDAALAELLVDQQPHTAFPATATRHVVDLAPEVTHLLALARFREPLGDASYLVFAVPRSADPCFYLGLDRSELDGGAFPPPGFDAAAFPTTCPPATAR